MLNRTRWKWGAMAACSLTLGSAVAHHVNDEVALTADVLFDFDTAKLTLASRQALDRIVLRVRSRVPEMISSTGRFRDDAPEIIMLIGHADRLESMEDKQSFSEGRAEAVKLYLVSVGVDANRVRTEGKANSQPMTKAGTCKEGSRTTMIQCLQPDRRVVPK
jgi:OmpA-OmpF porin, OOP family